MNRNELNQLKRDWQAFEEYAKLHFNGRDKVSKQMKAELQRDADEKFWAYKAAKMAFQEIR